jgi:hypothetical protein
MQPSVSSLPALASLSRDVVGGASADPWDAPYFGAPTYFAYHADSVPAPSAAVAGGTAPRGPASWERFPLLGGPIYDRFPPFVRGTDVAHVSSDTLAVTGPALEMLHPPYFGAPVHLTYEPGIPTFAHAVAPVSAAPSAPAAQPLAPGSTGGAVRRAGRQGGWLSWLLGKRG